MSVYTEGREAFTVSYLRELKRGILGSPYFTTNTLNRDFVGTRGFSLVFHAHGRAEVERNFPIFQAFLARALRIDCNAFYLNPLGLEHGARVDPHIDRSLRAYCKTVLPPLAVSVLYVDVPVGLVGGTLVLARGKKQLARVRPTTNALIEFGGDLTHSIERVDGPGLRLSLVCEQYALTDDELALIPAYALETRARTY